jgi:hypothetical protein
MCHSEVIHLGRTQDLEDDALFFLVAHDHGHGRQFVEFFASDADRGLADLALVQKYAAIAVENVHRAGQLNHEQEFAADAFAVRVMMAYGIDPLPAMASLLKTNFSSVAHPSRRARLERAAALVRAASILAARTN